MKRILAVLLCFALLFSFAACSKAEGKEPSAESKTTEENQTKVRLYAMNGPTGMGLAKLICDNDKAGESARYETTIVSSPDQVTAQILGGQCDIAAVPINLAATLYQKSQGKMRILCANTLGVLYMVENSRVIRDVSGLRGKTIYAPNPGSTPEYVLRYILKENGLDPDKDVNLIFLTGADEVAAKLATTPDAVGMLPEPKLSAFLAQNKTFRICLDMTAEWNKVSGEGVDLIQGVFVAKEEFVENHPDLVKQFLSDYNKSQEAIKADKKSGAEYIVKAGIIPNQTLAEKAIDGSNITYLDGSEMKKAVKKCLNVLFEANPKSVGEKLPGDDIYYEKQNFK